MRSILSPDGRLLFGTYWLTAAALCALVTSIAALTLGSVRAAARRHCAD